MSISTSKKKGNKKISKIIKSSNKKSKKNDRNVSQKN